MNVAEEKERRKAWRAEARADLCRPWLWIFLACCYAAMFVMASLLVFIGNLIGPYVPWFDKPYVSKDPPPLVTGFYCANVVLVMLVVAIPLLYILAPPRRIPFLSLKKNDNKKT